MIRCDARQRASGKRRLFAGHDHHAQLLRHALDEIGHRRMNLGVLDRVVVVEDQNDAPSRFGDLVEQRAGEVLRSRHARACRAAISVRGPRPARRSAASPPGSRGNASDRCRPRRATTTPTLAASLFSASQLGYERRLAETRPGRRRSVNGRLSPSRNRSSNRGRAINCGRGGGALILVLSSRVLAGTDRTTG